MKNNKEMVEMLIAKGVDVNFKNMFGNTPLRNAILMERAEIAELLKKHGAKE